MNLLQSPLWFSARLFHIASLSIGKYRLASTASYADRFVPDIVPILRDLSIALCAVLVAILVWIAFKFRSLNISSHQAIPGAIPEPASGGAFAARWGEIVRHMDSAKEAEWKFAIIEADKLVDLMLQRAGFPGDTLGERLMNIQEGQIQTLEGLWQAHKVRNRLAHDVGYFLRYSEAKNAIEHYADTLREFNAL